LLWHASAEVALYSAKLSESYGRKLELLTKIFWIVNSSSINQNGLAHVLDEVFRLEFF